MWRVRTGFPCGRQEELWLPQEGYYCVFVRTRDRVGNLAFAQSSVICCGPDAAGFGNQRGQ